MPSGLLGKVHILEQELLCVQNRCSQLEDLTACLQSTVARLESRLAAVEGAGGSGQEPRIQPLAQGQAASSSNASSEPAAGSSKAGKPKLTFRQRDSVCEIEGLAQVIAKPKASVVFQEGEEEKPIERKHKKRVPTSFVPSSGDTGVHFVEQEDEEEKPPGQRAHKQRVPTAFIKPGSEESEDDEDDEQAESRKKELRARFNDPEDDDDGSDSRRPQRQRQPTGFVWPGFGAAVSAVPRTMPPPVSPSVEEPRAAPASSQAGDKARVVFRGHDSINEVDGVEDPSKVKKAEALPKKALKAALRFAEEAVYEEANEDVDSPGTSPLRRPSRQRVPTAFVQGAALHVTIADNEEQEDNDEEVVVEPEHLRPVRSRLPTTFARAQAHSMPSDDEDEASGTEDVKVAADPVTEIERHKVPGAPKDVELLKATLRSLYFFQELGEDGENRIIEAMEVFAFKDGEEVTRQGSTTGTHFFIVAEGTFVVVVNGVEKSEITEGAAFGENVILLSGAETVTVRATCDAKAYGLRGVAVRQLMAKQYLQEHKEVSSAVNEILRSGSCWLLEQLTPFQTQCLYDRAAVESFERGHVLGPEGKDYRGEVYIVLSGRVSVQAADGTELHSIVPYGVVGDNLLAEAAEQGKARSVAEGPVQALVLGSPLLDVMFGKHLSERLQKSRMLSLLSRFEVFHGQSSEQLGEIARLGKVVDLEPSGQLEQPGVALALCLTGEVEAKLIEEDEDPKKATSEAQRLQGYAGDALGADRLLKTFTPFFFSARVVSRTAPAKMVLWIGKSLGNVMNMAMKRKSTLDSPSNSDRGQAQDAAFGPQSPSIKLAVLNDDKVGALKKVVVFRTLSPEQLARLAAALEVVKVEAGAVICERGEVGTEFYIIHRGQVEITINGKRVRTLGMGDYVGERALLFKEPRSATVRVLEASELWKMGSEAFLEVVQGPIRDYMKDRIAFQNTKVELSSLVCMRVVGRGGFGVVKMVKASDTGTRYALKCVSIKQAVAQKQQKALVNERSILWELDHPFIIKFVRSFRGQRYVYFLMELVTGGELLDALEVLGLLTPPQAQFYVGSIVLALEFLHERRIAYLDLKGENCLVDNHGYLKIIDFGVAEQVKDGRLHAVKGTPLFMAPEVILAQGYTTFADLWSLGVCLYDFMIGHFPFSNDTASQAEVFRAILKSPLKFPKWFRGAQQNQFAMTLMTSLLSREPELRPGAGPTGYAELKSHPFFYKFSWDGLLARQLPPPYIPKGETYAEDSESPNQKGFEGLNMSAAEEDTAGETDGWADPDPAWQEEFT